jgi:redox-regulated HSP33 family molecular chaperone
MKKFDKILEEKGIIKKGNKVWVSGGMIVQLILRGSMNNKEYKEFLLKTTPKETRDEWLRYAKILENFEIENKCRLIYDGEKVRIVDNIKKTGGG